MTDVETGVRSPTHADELRCQAKWRSIAHRIAVAMNPEYARHYTNWKDGRPMNPEKSRPAIKAPAEASPLVENSTQLTERALNGRPRLTPDQMLELRWGLYGEEFPEPLPQNPDLLDGQTAADLLETIADIERDNPQSAHTFSATEVDDQLEEAVVNTELARFFDDELLSCVFSLPWLDDMALKESAETTRPLQTAESFIENGYAGADVDWGVLNLEYAPRVLWQSLKEELGLEMTCLYRVMPGHQWFHEPDSSETRTVGHGQLIVGIQDISSWTHAQRQEVADWFEGEHSTDADRMLDLLTGGRYESREGDQLQQLVEDDRRSRARGPLNFKGEDDGANVVRHLAHLIHLMGAVRTNDDGEYDDKFYSTILTEYGAVGPEGELFVEALRRYIRQELPNLSVPIEEIDDKELLEYCARDVFLVTLTDGLPAEIPEEDHGPSAKIREESESLPGVCFTGLSSDLREEIKEYQEEQLDTVADLFKGALKERFGQNLPERIDQATNSTSCRFLLLFLTRGDMRSTAMYWILSDSRPFRLTKASSRSPLKLLIEMLQYVVYKCSPIDTHHAIWEKSARSQSTIQSRLGTGQRAETFIESRDLWR